MHPLLERARFAGAAGIGAALALLTLAPHPFAAPSVLASPLGQGNTTVSVQPAETHLTCGESAEVKIEISEVENLFGVDLKVSYDPAVVEVVDANATTPGKQIQQGDLPDVSGGQGLIQVNTVDEGNGTASYAAVRLNPAPAQSGTGTIAAINFKGKAAGTTAVTLASVILADRNARAISAELVNGKIIVDCDGGPRPTPTPRPSPPPPPPPRPGHGGKDGAKCTYTVLPGDTLFGIARTHGTSVSAIMAANRLVNPDMIYAGQTLAMPGCKGRVPPAQPPGKKPPPYRQPGGKCFGHVVTPGETLLGIALQYGTSVEALALANGIVNPNLIFVGQTIEICTGPGYGPIGPMPPWPGGPKPGPCRLTHMVLPGDTVFGLALQYGVSPRAIAMANNLANPHLIYVGQPLCIP